MLTYLELENFKNFKQATLKMGPMSILVGTNAAGKSNLRDAFRFIHGIARGYNLAEIIGEKWGDGGILQWTGIRGGTREAPFGGGSGFAMEVGFRSQGIHGDYRIAVEVGGDGAPPRVVAERLRMDGKVVYESETLPDGENEPGHFTIRLKRGGSHRKIGQKINCLDQRPALVQVADYPKLSPVEIKDDAKRALRELESMRFLDLDPEALRRPSLPGQTVLGDKGENLSSVLQAICQVPETKAALASWVAELTPMDATGFEFPADQTGKILVSLVEKDGSKISAYSASDGTLRFLAMVAALLGKEASRFYFFEELDNGIHPARLHLLLELIERQTRAGNLQMVATTHSPDLLGQLSPVSLETASLVYRLQESPEGNVIRILDIPGAKEILRKQTLNRLHATGWLEDAVFFTADDRIEGVGEERE